MRSSPVVPPRPGAFPFATTSKTKVSIADQSKLLLPRDPAAVLPSAKAAFIGPLEWEVPQQAGALRALLTAPALAVPLPAPDLARLRPTLGDLALRREATPRQATLMLAAETVGAPRVVGFAQLTVIENGAAFGQPILAEAMVDWFYTLDSLVPHLMRVRSTMSCNDEGQMNQRALLLGFPMDADWTIRTRLARFAASYGVALRCVPPEPGRYLHNIKAKAKQERPGMLYVWRDHGVDLRIAEQIANSINPPASIVLLEERSVDDTLIEFGWHLAEQIGLNEDLQAIDSGTGPKITWNGLVERLNELPGQESADAPDAPFIVHADAIECCRKRGYGYPDAQRISDHIEKLISAATQFSELRGRLPRRFEDWIRDEFGLDVALFDSNQSGKNYRLNGRDFNDLPHIKVDDAKHGKVSAGRIHFVVNGEEGQIMLTYVGRHR